MPEWSVGQVRQPSGGACQPLVQTSTLITRRGVEDDTDHIKSLGARLDFMALWYVREHVDQSWTNVNCGEL